MFTPDWPECEWSRVQTDCILTATSLAIVIHIIIAFTFNFYNVLLGPLYGAIAVPCVTRCRRRRCCCGHRCAGGDTW